MDVSLKWMGGHPQAGGVRFGVPFAKGALRDGTPLYLRTEDGMPVAVQVQPQAWWPDGSVKWTLQSAVLENPAQEYVLTTDEPGCGKRGQEALSLRLTRGADGSIAVNTGCAVWTLRTGSAPIDIRFGANCSRGRLVALLEEQLETGEWSSMLKDTLCDGVVEQLELEREGALHAVVLLRGRHFARTNAAGGRGMLPFELRLYFFAGQAAVRMVHTVTYKENPKQGFVKGLGLDFSLPLSGGLHNRFVRFGGESGLFCESPKMLWTREDREGTYRRQLAGELTPENQRTVEDDRTIWSDFKLTQLCSDHYDIAKRVGREYVYVRGAAGRRASGLAYAGAANGGFAVFRRDFWQKCPSALEVNGLSTPEANIRLWFYSPDGQRMDMRHYSDETHMPTSYDDYSDMHSSPYGIANTNEAVVETFGAYPGNEALAARAGQWQAPGLLMASPAYILSTLALGDAWAPEDRSTPGRARVEGYLDDLLEQHKRVREQFDMYGFWDYGDIRHTYDYFRHNWLYDTGGYAWQNTELVPNFWLWFGFLRSGREDYFRWAEAMTRHNSECDVYHLGAARMLGSRHNVLHWGCGCKESRISLSSLYKIYYYLTGDERTGENLTLVKDIEYALATIDPLRELYPEVPGYPVHLRFGPDVMVLVDDWNTRWERTQDTRYRDKILNLLSYFKEPDSFASSTVSAYNPYTGALKILSKTPATHFNYCFGGEYVWPMVLHVLDDPALWRAFLNEGLIFSANGDPDGIDDKWEQDGLFGAAGSEGTFKPRGSMKTYFNGAAAYAAGKAGDETLAQQCWADLLRDEAHKQHDAVAVPIVVRPVDSAGVHKHLDEAGHLTGNGTGQWGSHAIVMLAWIGQWLK